MCRRRRPVARARQGGSGPTPSCELLREAGQQGSLCFAVLRQRPASAVRTATRALLVHAVAHAQGQHSARRSSSTNTNHHLASPQHHTTSFLPPLRKTPLPSKMSNQDTAPFFGFIGAAAALVFSCRSKPAVAGREGGGWSSSFSRPPFGQRERGQSAGWSLGLGQACGGKADGPRAGQQLPLISKAPAAHPEGGSGRLTAWSTVTRPCRAPLMVACPPTHSHPPLARAGMGAAYGTAKSGVGIASMGVMRPELVMKSIVPVVMAGVLGIYGLIIAVIISTGGACARGVAAEQGAGQRGMGEAVTQPHAL